jgi:hypothetical protein
MKKKQQQVKIAGSVAVSQGSLKLRGQAKINGCVEFPTEVLANGKCQMITSTKSDQVECDYEVSYTHIGPLKHLSLDILPMNETAENTGNAFPGCDGWVFYDFSPSIPELFPTDTEGWRTTLVPRMSDYMEFSQSHFADGDIWTATFHPEQALSLSYQTGLDLFHTGETWKITERMQFPVPSL